MYVVVCVGKHANKVQGLPVLHKSPLSCPSFCTYQYIVLFQCSLDRISIRTSWFPDNHYGLVSDMLMAAAHWLLTCYTLACCGGPQLCKT